MPRSEPRPLRVFAPGFYSFENKGDAALLFAMRGTLEREFGAVELTLTSFTAEDDRCRAPVAFLPMPLEPQSVFGGGVRALLRRWGQPRLAAGAAFLHVGLFLGAMAVWARLARRAPGGRRLLPRRVRAVVEAIEGADVAVAVPGGYLLAPAVTDVWWLYHVATFGLVRLLGKPLVLYPCSLGPFPGPHRAVARALLPRCERILVREEASRQVALELGVPAARVAVLPDAAFAFEDDGRGEEESRAARRRLAGLPHPWVGVSVRHFHFPGSPDPAAAYAAYLAAVARAVDYVTAELGGSVVFVPQVGGKGEATDISVAEQIRRLARDPARAILLDEELSPQALSALYGEFAFMIGTRMHACILAMLAGTPAVAIAYGHKTTGTMAMLGLADAAVPIDQVDALLLGRVEALWTNLDAVRASLAARVADARRRVQSSAVEVRAVLGPRPAECRPGSAARPVAPVRAGAGPGS